MSKDAPTVQSTATSIIKKFDEYVKEKGYPNDKTLSSLPVIILVGYFLKVHSKDPVMAVMQYLNDSTITYKISTEVKMILNALETR